MNYHNDALLRLLQSDAGTVRGGCGGTRSGVEERGRGSSCEGDDIGAAGAGAGACLAGVSLAMVYAPVQSFQSLYEPEEALSRGTIFQELEKPFLGGRGR